MEAPLSNRTIKHEIKLPKYLIVLLGMMVIGLFANAFSPAFSIKEAFAYGHNISLGDVVRQLRYINKTLGNIDCSR